MSSCEKQPQGAGGMLLDRYSRFLLRHQLRFRSERNHGVPLPFQSDPDAPDGTQDVETALREAKGTTRGRLVLRNQDEVALTEIDVRPDDRIAIMLFRRSDPNAATPIFEHQKTRRIRRADKGEDEAVAVSAHLFVNLDKIPGGHPSYRAIMEEVPGLGRSYVHHLIANILRESKYLYTDRHGDEKQTYTVLDFHGIKTDKIGDVMSGSTIPSIHLVRPGRLEGFDTEGLVVPRDERMTLALNATPDRALPVIERLRRWAFGHDWQDMLVQVALPEQRSRTIPLSRTEDAADVLFTRAEQVSVPTAMDPCTDTINEELTKKAIEAFDNKEGWR